MGDLRGNSLHNVHMKQPCMKHLLDNKSSVAKSVCTQLENIEFRQHQVQVKPQESCVKSLLTKQQVLKS